MTRNMQNLRTMLKYNGFNYGYLGFLPIFLYLCLCNSLCSAKIIDNQIKNHKKSFSNLLDNMIKIFDINLVFLTPARITQSMHADGHTALVIHVNFHR